VIDSLGVRQLFAFSIPFAVVKSYCFVRERVTHGSHSP
jgi:hypothetical protein